MAAGGDYFAGRRIWITGASTGIGAACVREFVRRGARVAASARNRQALESLVAELGADRVLAVPFDVTKKDEHRAAVERIVEAFGWIDTAFFNAGTWEPTDLANFDSSVFEMTFAVNFLGMVYGIEAVLPVLERGSRPHLVGMSSSAAFRGLPRAEAYGASKAAIRYLLQAIRCQLRPRGVPVTIVCPGFVKSPLTDKNDFPMQFLMEAQDAARRIADGLAAGKYEIRFPKPFIAILRVMGWLPDSLYTRIMARRVGRT